MSETASHTIWLTQEAYDKLQGELDHLSGPGRAEASAKIARARDEGDLRENGGYPAARAEPGAPGAPVRHAQGTLRHGPAGDGPGNNDDGAPRPHPPVPFDGDESRTAT